MNKKFFAAAAIAALMGAGGYFAKSSTTQNDGLSDLELSNAEALADNTEAGSSSSWTCWSQTESKAGATVWMCGNPCERLEGSKGTGPTSDCNK